MKKAALELSANIIVVIIISVIIVGLGIMFVFNIVKQASNLEQQVMDQTREEMEQALASGDVKVLVPNNLKQTEKGSAIFGIGIFNEIPNAAQSDFTLAVSDPMYYETPSAEGVQKSAQIAYDENAVSIKKNEYALKLVIIKLPENAASGNYVFTVTVNNNGNVYDVKQFIAKV
ncbi:hypothetical protein C4573_05210 [Candidatus Woesearchaeota archaeon]|nr:MAG: hypothetical protein C4573_05210 [Candidatus Woesearchaeota archaeon]